MLEVATETASDAYRKAYEQISISQDIERRMRSFERYDSYHFKDLYYLRRLLAMTKHEIRAVLDVGCCGTPYPRLFDLGKVRYTAVDISTTSLNRMREIYPDSPIEWVLDDASTLQNIEDEAYDLVIATQVFEHLPAPELALAAVARKLKVGGRIAIGTESAIFLDSDVVPRFMGLLSELCMNLGLPFTLYAQKPYYYPYKIKTKVPGDGGQDRTVCIPHGIFHPRYFEFICKDLGIGLKSVFERYTGGVIPDVWISPLGEIAYFRWLEIRARLPLVRYTGSQLFVALEKVA